MQSRDQRLCIKCQGLTAANSMTPSAIRAENNCRPTRYTSATEPQLAKSMGSLTEKVEKPNSLIKGTMQ